MGGNQKAVKCKGREWRAQILKGVDRITFPGCECGVIILLGDKSEAIVVNNRGQVLCAAAEYGKGRIVIFSHNVFVDSILDQTIKHKNTKFYRNIRQWVSKGHDKGSEIPSFKDFMDNFKRLPTECQILGWSGMVNPLEHSIEQLSEWVERGGGLICGASPRDYARANRQEIDDMLLCYLLRKIDIVYGGIETYICDDDETFTREIDSECIKPQDIIAVAKQFPEKCVKLSNMLPYIPHDIFEVYELDINDILRRIQDGVHYIPSKTKPLDSVCGKKAAILTNKLMIRNGLNGKNVHAEGFSEFPGAFSKQPELQSASLNFNSNCYKIHPTGYYLPAGTVMEVTLSKTRKSWAILIGLHIEELYNADFELRRWPKISMRKRMKSSSFNICSPFGGLVYLESPQGLSDMIDVELKNVVPAPMFMYSRAINWELIERPKPGLWCDVVGDKISFTLPSTAVRQLQNPSQTMMTWDAVISAYIELRGKDTSEGRGQWVITDEQFCDIDSVHCGYPIVISLENADPNKSYDDCFVLNGDLLLKKGCWELFSKLGRNFHDTLWTWKDIYEVTASIFTLYAMEIICNIKPWSHPVLREQFDGALDYLDVGANYYDVCKDSRVALMLYAQLARDFGWNTYKTVFGIYNKLPEGQKPKTQREKEVMWILTLSEVTNRNLCPVFEFWGWQISTHLLEELQIYPPYLPDDETTKNFAKSRSLEISKKYHFEFPISPSFIDTWLLAKNKPKQIKVPVKRNISSDSDSIQSKQTQKRQIMVSKIKQTSGKSSGMCSVL